MCPLPGGTSADYTCVFSPDDPVEYPFTVIHLSCEYNCESFQKTIGHVRDRQTPETVTVYYFLMCY